jgi:hypothetical protein
MGKEANYRYKKRGGAGGNPYHGYELLSVRLVYKPYDTTHACGADEQDQRDCDRHIPSFATTQVAPLLRFLGLRVLGFLLLGSSCP